MNRYLLLILLSSWAHVVPLSLQCDTGVAYPHQKISVPRSLMANADVALLTTYHAETLDKCITDCCTEKFGSCTVASFKKNVNGSNCQHFNCRPVTKCKFLSSNSTDSFSFTSSSLPHNLVPSSHASKNESLTSTVPTYTTKESRLDPLFSSVQTQGVTKEAIATYSEDQLDYKDDNTTIKPRKGVEEVVSDNSFENVTRSGIKPRKGVKLDGIINSENSKSKVKPRKGVGPYESHSSTPLKLSIEPTTTQSYYISKDIHSTSTTNKTYKDLNPDDLVSALQKVFEDDTKVKEIKPSTTLSPVSTDISLTSSVAMHSVTPTTLSTVHVSSSMEDTTSSVLRSSLSTVYVTTSSSSAPTPGLTTVSVEATEVVSHSLMPSTSSPTIFEHSKILFQELSADGKSKSKEFFTSDDSAESENERKYKSSMHLVLSLVFGLLVLFSVLGVVAKRVYDGWMRRHYRRMDFLIDGMYNGYG